MAPRIRILSAALALQIVLAVSLFFLGRGSGAFRSEEKLIDLDLGSVDEITIEDGKETSLAMRQEGGTWVLPDHFGFPVSMSKLRGLSEKLLGSTKPWPVGTTEVAARRFEVADDDFERKITFSKGDGDDTTLLIGTSPGFKKVHARLAGDQAIYAIDFSAYQASVKPEDWEDKDFLSLEQGEIDRVEMPGVTLVRKGEELIVSDLGEAEETNPAEVNTLLSKVSKPSFLGVLGTESKPEYRQDAPALAYTLEMKSGEKLTYTYSKPKEEEDFVLKVSSHPDYFKTSKYSVDRLRELTREKLVREKKAAEDASGSGQADSDRGETSEGAGKPSG